MSTEFGLYGVDKLLQSKSCQRKITWALLTSAATSALTICLYLMYEGFRKSPYAVIASRYEVTSFPAVTYIPSHAPSVRTLEQMGLTLGDYMYLQMHIAYTFAFEQHVRGDQSLTALIEKELAKKRVKAVIGKHNITMMQLLAATSLRPEELIHCHGECTTYVSAGMAGVTYTSEPSAKLNSFLAGYAIEGQYVTIKHQPDEGQKIKRYYKGVRGRLAIGDRAKSMIPSPRYFVPVAPMQILIHLIVNKFTRGRNCRKGITMVQQDDCLMGCYAEICKEHGLCNPLMSDPDTACYWVDQAEGSRCDLTHGEKAQLTKRCEHECLMPCEEAIYGITMQQLQLDEANETEVVLHYANTFTAQNFEEKYVYTWDILVSNIGGQVSLWFGASVLAVPQMLFWIIDHLHIPDPQDSSPYKETKLPVQPVRIQ